MEKKKEKVKKKNDEKPNFWDKLKSGFSSKKFEEVFSEPIVWVLVIIFFGVALYLRSK